MLPGKGRWPRNRRHSLLAAPSSPPSFPREAPGRGEADQQHWDEPGEDPEAGGRCGLGQAFFVTGARLLPAPIAALIGTLEPVLAPIWVWLVHTEVPSQRTLIGGAIVMAALFSHILWEAFGRHGETG